MEVSLKRLSGLKFEIQNSDQKSATVDGAKAHGGTEDGLRPMELVLSALGSCSSFDVVLILQKQKQEIEDFQVLVKGDRADSVPSVFTDIHVHFQVKGKVDPEKLNKAVTLSLEKYCSVSKMLAGSVNITHSSEVI